MSARSRVTADEVRAVVGARATVTNGSGGSVRVNATGAPAHSAADIGRGARHGRLCGGSLWREKEREHVAGLLALAGLAVAWQSSRSGVVTRLA